MATQGTPPVSARASGAVGQDGVRVKLDQPEQFGGALVLKSERIVYCPIQKVRYSQAGRIVRMYVHAIPPMCF